MKKCLIIGLLSATAVFTSCQKETSFDTISPESGTGGGGNNGGNGGGTDSTGTATSLIGTWTFTGMKAKLVSDLSVTESGFSVRSVTTTEYTTTNNSGTFTFTADKASTKDLTYTVNTTSKVKMYMDGTTQEAEMPFAYTAPKSSSTGAYKAIGADSIYMPAGGAITMPDNSGYNGTVPTVAAGYKYKIEGKKMTMTLNTNYKPSFPSVPNTTINGNSSINLTMTFQKN